MADKGLDDLAAFVEVGDARSFTAAATKLVSEPPPADAGFYSAARCTALPAQVLRRTQTLNGRPQYRQNAR
jgi:hypothetical protein